MNYGKVFPACFKNPVRHAPVLALGLCVAFSALADTTIVSVSDSNVVTSNTPVILHFPVVRSADTGYEEVLTYHTVNGTAIAGTDYTATTGSITLPAGSTSASIPVTVAAHTTGGTNRTLQLKLDTATGIGRAPSFVAAQNFVTGQEHLSVAAADVNGDGKPDLIAPNYADDDLSVLLNTTAFGAATPSFAAQQTFASGRNPVRVAAVDLNRDGKPDLVTANYSDNTISVLLNTTAPGAATASFAAQQTFAAGQNPSTATAADINGDGNPDLIVANLTDDNVSVLLNTTVPGDATASFAAQQTFATGHGPFSVAAADFNRDGSPDLIVVNTTDDTVSVLLNTTAPGAAAPSFAAQQAFATGQGAYSATAADVNGDGSRDVIVVNTTDNTVSVLLDTTVQGAATPSFAAQQAFAAGQNPFSITAANLNGDGSPDLIVTNYPGNTISVLRNTTAPRSVTAAFAAPQAFATGVFPYTATTADLNGDGSSDLIVGYYMGSAVSVLLNATPPPAMPNFSAQQTFATGPSPYAVAAADFNGDGRPDLVTSLYYNDVSVLLNTTAPGATISGFTAQQTFATGRSPLWVGTADLNRDGRPDLITTNLDDNDVSVLLNTTTPGAVSSSFSAQHVFGGLASPYSGATADVNGDGSPDLIVANIYNAVSVLLNTTTPGAAAPSFADQQFFFAGSGTYSLTAADLDDDGRPDLIVGNLFDGTVSVRLNTTVPGAAIAGFAAKQTFATGGQPLWVGTADLNRDGRLDLIAANYDNNTVSVLLNTSAPGAAALSFAGPQTFATGITPYSASLVDFDGDGRPDLSVANSQSSAISVLFNTTAPGAATPSFAAQRAFAIGGDPFILTAADFNGDGRPDLVAPNNSGNDVSVLLNTQYESLIDDNSAIGTMVHTTHIVTPSAGANGTITPSTPQTVNNGVVKTFAVSPATGYNAAVGGTCGGTLVGKTYTTNPITADCTITASFTIKSFTVTPSSGTHGSISPTTAQVVTYGSTTSFTVTPNTGYTASVTGGCGGTLVGTTYTTNAIIANCTVVASFKIKTFAVTPSAGANGAITPSTPQTTNYGTTRSFTVTPNSGYSAAVGGTCGGTLVGKTYTTNSITADCTVTASFTMKSYTVTPGAGVHGSISPSTAQVVIYGSTTSFTVTPDGGYTASVGGTCGGTLVGTTYTTYAIAANCTVAASFH